MKATWKETTVDEELNVARRHDYHIPWLIRFSKTDSSTILSPLHVESNAIVRGWRSVGNPGNGFVLILNPRKSSPIVRGTAEIWSH